MRRPSPLVLAAALVLGPALGACTGDEPEADPSTTTSTAVSTTTTDAPPSHPQNGPATAAPDPDDVVAEAALLVPGSRDEKVRVGVARIVVSGKLMELDLVFTPAFDDHGKAVSVWDMTNRQHHISLLDRVNLKQYEVVRDGPFELASDSVYTKALAGRTVGYQVFFPAPEDHIDVVDVSFLNGWPSFQDVPVTYGD